MESTNSKIMEQNTMRFESLLAKIKRKGVQELLDYLHNETDFFTAPASTNFHLACPGGLIQHSLNVFDCLVAKLSNPIWKKVLENVPEESLIISSILHDICKANSYSGITKNSKTYSPEKVAMAEKWKIKHDDMGDFIWETVPGYTSNHELLEPFGHGEKSVWIVSRFIELTKEEAYAIRWHMGFSEPKENYNAVGKAMELCPLVVAVHEADLDASKLLEDVSGNKEFFEGLIPAGEDVGTVEPTSNTEKKPSDETWPFDDDECPFN